MVMTATNIWTNNFRKKKEIFSDSGKIMPAFFRKGISINIDFVGRY
jgi:hypothetical protein